jgi:hypothetical protein
MSHPHRLLLWRAGEKNVKILLPVFQNMAGSGNKLPLYDT